MRLITQLGIVVTAAGVVMGIVTGEAVGWYVALIAAIFTTIEYLAFPRPAVEALPPLVQLGPEKDPTPPVPMFVPPPQAAATPVQTEAPAKPKRTRKPKADKPTTKPAAKPPAKSATKPAAITAAKKPAPKATRSTKK